MKRFSLALVLAFAGIAGAQSTTTGDITGKVTDPTGAAISGATVVLTSLDQGTARTVKTDSQGAYRFPLLRPGTYSLKESGQNMTATVKEIAVNVGQATTVDLTAKPGSGNEVVEVLSGEPLLQVEDANISTTFSQLQMQELPLAGADLTSAALTTPGAVMSTGGGLSSNFFIFGLPGTGNLFTLNGADLMDPYYNINNSGASNNSLGVNEIQETSIVANGYSAQYGRLPGATVSYLTKSGTNQFHGNALYQYNGSFANARDWFTANNPANYQPGVVAGGRTRTVSNQWGGSIGGPIWRDKVFGFFDDEGLRYVSAAQAATVYIPSPQFQSAVTANIAANHPAEAAYYAQIFKLYNGANGAGNAQTTTGVVDSNLGCADFNGKTLNGVLFGNTGTKTSPIYNAPCSSNFTSKNNNLNTEQLFTIRIDQNIGAKDKVFYRYQHDWGIQATGTDPINPAFSANSVQPEWNGQFNETHVFTQNIVNNFTFAGSYYKAIFGPSDYAGAIATFPTTVLTAGFTVLGGTDQNYPSGRNVAQYQFVDDLSIVKGRHTMKMGLNFRRNQFALFSTRTFVNGLSTLYQSDFASGVTSASSTMQYGFPTTGAAEIQFYSMGYYFQDQIAVAHNLKLTASLRLDRNANPSARDNNFVRLATPFYALPNKGGATPYNQSILTNQKNAYASVEVANLQPRLGFAYTPDMFHGKTVFRGGAGVFMDSPLLAATSRFTSAAPADPQFVVTGSGTQLVDPSQPGSLKTSAIASNTAFQNGFATGQSLATINGNVIAAGALGGYTPPAYAASIDPELKNPTYVEYNFEVQHQLTHSDAIDINYVGNFGFNVLFQDATENGASLTGFGGLPTSQPDPRFGAVTTLTNRGHSNYNGITAGLRHQVVYGLTASVNYTYSKTLGNTNNGGLYAADTGIQTDPLLQIVPNNPDILNYGPLDYDVRHNLNANYVWDIPAHFNNRIMQQTLGGWTVSGVAFYKTGTPYSVVNAAARTGATTVPSTVVVNSKGVPVNVATTTTTSYVLAGFLGGSKTVPCNNPHDVCLQQTQFAGGGLATDSTTQSTAQAPYGFGNLALNSFRGPHFFDTDMRILKSFKIREKYALKLGVTANNVINHPNFATPTNSVTSGTFGKIQATVVSSPSSLYGNGQGSSPSGRVIAFNAGLSF